MPAPKKIYFDPKNPPAPRLDGDHLVVPFPALQGLLRALLSRWNVDDVEKRRLEQQLIGAVCTLGDPKWLKSCEEDASPVQEPSIQKVAAYMTKAILAASKPCPTWLLQLQAQAMDQLLRESIYSQLGARNSNHVVGLLRTHLPPVQERFRSVSIFCRDKKTHPLGLPTDEVLHSWAKISQPAKLRNIILAYYHEFKNHRSLAQLLAGKTK